MSFPVVVWILTALAAVAIVLTRLRLSGDGAAGRFSISRLLPLTHFVAGMIALDKAEADFYTQAHASTAVAFATLIARALTEGEARQSYA